MPAVASEYSAQSPSDKASAEIAKREEGASGMANAISRGMSLKIVFPGRRQLIRLESAVNGNLAGAGRSGSTARLTDD